jgi:hypothetical protein
MANIITVLEKEIEKKNLYVDEKGNTINPEKIEAMAKKSYLNDLKVGAVDFSVSFETYHAQMLASYIPLDSIIGVIKDVIHYDSLYPSIPEPVMSEEVAN